MESIIISEGGRSISIKLFVSSVIDSLTMDWSRRPRARFDIIGKKNLFSRTQTRLACRRHLSPA